METRISLAVSVQGDSCVAKVTVYMGIWDEDKIMYHAIPYRGEVAVTPLNIESSVYPYAVASLRDASDRAIAEMLERFSHGEVFLMEESHEHKEKSGVATGD